MYNMNQHRESFLEEMVRYGFSLAESKKILKYSDRVDHYVCLMCEADLTPPIRKKLDRCIGFIREFFEARGIPVSFGFDPRSPVVEIVVDGKVLSVPSTSNY